MIKVANLEHLIVLGKALVAIWQIMVTLNHRKVSRDRVEIIVCEAIRE